MDSLPSGRRFLLALAGASLLLAGCQDATGPVGPEQPEDGVPASPSVSSVEITPAEDTLTRGEERTFDVVATSSASDTLDVSVAWSSTDRSVAHVESGGHAVADGVGTTSIIAEAEGVADTARLTVVRPAVAEVGLSLAHDTIDVEGWTEIRAVARDDSGDTLAVDLSFRSEASGVATVDSTGRVDGAGPGEAVLVAEADNGVADSVRLVVQQLTADVAAGALNLRPRGILLDSTTTADVVIENRGGYLDELHWTITSGGEALHSGVLIGVRSRTTDTISVDGIGPFSTRGRHDLQLEINSNGAVDDVSAADDTASNWLKARPEGFDVEIVFDGAVPDSLKQVVRKAARRWEEIVVGDLPDLTAAEVEGDRFLSEVGRDTLPVDDVVFIMEARALDSYNGLAYGPSTRNGSSAGTAIAGRFILDPTYEGDQYANALHEMGHLLGLAGNNSISGRTVKTSVDGESRYIGAGGVHQWQEAGGDTDYIPMRNGAHLSAWAIETISMMVDGSDPALTTITAASLQDMTYAVDMSQAVETEVHPDY